MPRPDACLAEPWFPSALRQLWPCLVLALTGCQLTPARFGPGSCIGSSRCLTLTHQVAADTCLYAAHHPLRSTKEWLYETTDHVYCLSQGAFGKRCWLPLLGAPGPLAPPGEVIDALALEYDLQGFAGKDLEPACVQLYAAGHEAHAALSQLIDGATEQLDILMFEWDYDAVGRAIVERVQARAVAGVRVRILVDGGGNLIFGRSDHAAPESINRVVNDLAQHQKLELRRTRNPFGRFDHRKLVLVDGRIAWSGGRNLVCRAFTEHRDLSYTLTGPLVAEMQERFESSWQEQGPEEKCTSRVANNVAPDPNLQSSICNLPSPNAWARLVYTEPGDHLLQRTLHRALDRARHHVYVENVYFTDGHMLCKLIQARRRGVDVRVILTVHSTTPPINGSNRVTANRLLKAGVRVFLYPGMTHAKAAVVDGCWAYVGTGNLDPLSLRHNHEIGLAIGAGPAIEQLENCLFHPGFQPEWELREPLPVTAADYLCEFLAAWCF